MSAYKALLFLAVATVVVASPLPVPDVDESIIGESRNLTGIPDVNELGSSIVTPVGGECAVIGNPLLYPTGLRVGTYLQWFATIIANSLLLNTARNMRCTTILFQIATLSGLCWAVNNLVALDGLEGFILLTLCIGAIPALTLSPAAEGKSRGTWTGSITRHATFLAVFIFGAWFWFTGLEMTGTSRCSRDIKLFHFIKFSLYGRFLQFNKAFTIIGSIAMATLVCWESLGFLKNIQRDGRGPKEAVKDVLKGDFRKDHMLQSVLINGTEKVSGAVLLGAFISVLAIVLTIEGALDNNNVEFSFNLTTPTELIPFLLGLGNMLRVILGLVNASMKGSLRLPSLDGSRGRSGGKTSSDADSENICH